jgi:hypothetical protein
MITPIIKTAASALDEASIIEVLVRANWADPAARWVWPDSQQFLMHFPSFVRAFGGKAFAHGSAYYVDGYVGAALWLPPDVHPDENVLIALVQQTVSEQIQKDFFPVLEQMGRSSKRASLVFAAYGCRPVSTRKRIWLSVIATHTSPV